MHQKLNFFMWPFLLGSSLALVSGLGLLFGSENVAFEKWTVSLMVFITAFVGALVQQHWFKERNKAKENRGVWHFLMQGLLRQLLFLGAGMLVAGAVLAVVVKPIVLQTKFWLFLLPYMGLYLAFMAAVFFVRWHLIKWNRSVAGETTRALQELKTKAEELVKTATPELQSFGHWNRVLQSVRASSDAGPLHWEYLVRCLELTQKSPHEKWVPLEKELALAENYLELMQLIYGAKLEVHFTIPASSNKKLPRLILMDQLEVVFNSLQFSTEQPAKVVLKGGSSYAQLQVTGAWHQKAPFGKTDSLRKWGKIYMALGEVESPSGRILDGEEREVFIPGMGKRH